MVPVLRDPAVRLRDHAFHCYSRAAGNRLGRAIRTDRYRLVEWLAIGNDPANAVVEFNDYTNGPVEKKNMAAENPNMVQELRAILARHPRPRPPGQGK